MHGPVAEDGRGMAVGLVAEGGCGMAGGPPGAAGCGREPAREGGAARFRWPGGAGGGGWPDGRTGPGGRERRQIRVPVAEDAPPIAGGSGRGLAAARGRADRAVAVRFRGGIGGRDPVVPRCGGPTGFHRGIGARRPAAPVAVEGRRAAAGCMEKDRR